MSIGFYNFIGTIVKKHYEVQDFSARIWAINQ